MRIPHQIREVVGKYPGISNVDLPRMLVMAALATVPDLRRHAEAARCKVDVDDRWWPTCLVADLKPGMQMQYRNNHEDVLGREWVTITSVDPSPADPTNVEVSFTRDDGSPSSGPNIDPIELVAYIPVH